MSNDTGHLKTGTHEFIKQYLVYTSSNLTTVYEARADAVNGTPCMKTTYTYVAGTNRVEKMKEETATWSSAYDI